ncbi:transposase, partial [Amycolatopsis rhizosphaerae]
MQRWGDALFELADALVCVPQWVGSLPGLSLEPEFRRGHGSVYAALTRGRIDVAGLRRLLLGTVGAGREGLVWFAGDVSNWSRPDAVCSPQRLVVHDKSARTLAGHPVTSGWPFAVMAGLEWGASSWTAPVDVARLGPADTLTGVTLSAIGRVTEGLVAQGRTEVAGFVFDAEYDLMALSHRVSGRAHIVGRLRANQVFYAAPEPGARGRGRP